MKKYLPKNIFVWIPVLMIIIAIPAAILFSNNNKQDTGRDNLYPKNETTTTDDTEPSTDKSSEETNPPGTIIVEAGDGILEPSEYDSLSYVEESARGLEAYLASGGTSVIYSVESPVLEKYTLWIKLSDDGVHDDDSRSATIVVNNNQTLAYVHKSEDTRGWKWFKIGETTLQEGFNTIVFTKNASTSAAFVMDEFKLIPFVE